MTVKKCTKKRDARAKLLFGQTKPVAFLTFPLPSPSSLLNVCERDTSTGSGRLTIHGQCFCPNCWVNTNTHSVAFKQSDFAYKLDPCLKKSKLAEFTIQPNQKTTIFHENPTFHVFHFLVWEAAIKRHVISGQYIIARQNKFYQISKKWEKKTVMKYLPTIN